MALSSAIPLPLPVQPFWPWNSDACNPDTYLAKAKGCHEVIADAPLRCGFFRCTQLMEEQAPAAVVLACSDSRCPPEMVFDQGLGDLYCLRWPQACRTCLCGISMSCRLFCCQVLARSQAWHALSCARCPLHCGDNTPRELELAAYGRQRWPSAGLVARCVSLIRCLHMCAQGIGQHGERLRHGQHRARRAAARGALRRHPRPHAVRWAATCCHDHCLFLPCGDPCSIPQDRCLARRACPNEELLALLCASLDAAIHLTLLASVSRCPAGKQSSQGEHAVTRPLPGGVTCSMQQQLKQRLASHVHGQVRHGGARGAQLGAA